MPSPRRRMFVAALLALASCSHASSTKAPAPTGGELAVAASTGRLLGTVATPDGHPIAGASIGFTFFAEDSAHMPTGLPMFTTDADGEFLAPYLPPRDYTVVATVPSGFGETQTVRIERGRVAAVHFVFDTARGAASEPGTVPGPGVVLGSRGATFAIPLAWLRTVRGGLDGMVSWGSTGRVRPGRPGPAGLRFHVADSVVGRGSLGDRLRSAQARSFAIQPVGAIDATIEQEAPVMDMRLQGAMLIVALRSGTAFNDLWRSQPDSVRVDRGSWQGRGPPAGWLTLTHVEYIE